MENDVTRLNYVAAVVIQCAHVLIVWFHIEYSHALQLSSTFDVYADGGLSQTTLKRVFKYITC